MESVKFSVVWAMPNRWTFSIPPIRVLLDRWLVGCGIIVDPFSGKSTIANYRNDLGFGGFDAEEWCNALLPGLEGLADAVLFDPPYSPRQISECYNSIGRKPTSKDTQNASLYRRVKEPLKQLLKPGGIAISFGWNSQGFGRAWPTEEIMLVQHGGAHNDTIVVVQRKPNENID